MTGFPAPSIDIVGAAVDFPIFDAKTRSLKKAVLGRAGGKIGTGSRVPRGVMRRRPEVSLPVGGDRTFFARS